MTLKKSDPILQVLSTKAKSAFKKPTTMAELLASTGNKIPVLRRGQEVTGKVISVSRQEILIDIGAKSEGIVFGREFASVRDLAANLSAGDQIDAIVIYPENDAGQVVLSLRKLSGEKRWEELEVKKSGGESIDVIAQEVNRGGIICDWLGLRGFLPASQLAHSTGSGQALRLGSGQAHSTDSTRSLQSGHSTLRDEPLGSDSRSSGQALRLGSGQAQPQANMNDLIGKTLKVKVIEVDKNTNRLIFSQKQPDETSLKNLQKLLLRVDIGDKYTGTVSAVLPFGLFVEIDVQEESTKSTKGTKGDSEEASRTSRTSDTSRTSKLEGLVHISEISWEKVEDVAKLFKVGDKVEVAVIAKEESTARLNLSVKQLTQDPFAEASKKYSKDQIVTGTVERVTPYGVFVTLGDGLEGMVHISKIPPNETLEVGKSLECMIESIDTAVRKISLVPVSREKPILYR
ncbi:hypothetical protein A3I53_04105 [Candidatus Curtissbacteria bacterium RIFCSPLOWO2_02_FULL_40_13b]|uniref:S1 motif domain-containing protein n=3 Tax=Candidatus Curtissiibacteriota TaxID=1752717 RepID=A0A1F5HQB9_9BACT|nr:MAG: hypothetical protein A2693_03790 [Candidatus Curtissbacteria bacterium RIFCSPHIGHO2_01_FULL_40_12]OGE05097.1 MAG: hypothetical protein A3F45_03510 [Candidatus Curtissbacteria bacterium RIFCSPHIGHO2_12_FULL_41_17]OGE06351.1 MAG: hypothetical protein A3I53_04105 [Candidatus Curtissbacteria bacterium RIFCSPLOWO2_02_FULL_40_13b]